jgi:hypothetical protein
MSDEYTPIPDDPLRAAALRLTAAAPEFVGYWLARHREHEKLSERDLLARLRLKYANLPLLALGATPRPDHFADDVRAVAARCKADPVALAELIAREQARLAAATAPVAGGAPLPAV